MVTDQQLDHYRTFWFVVLPAHLGQRGGLALAQDLDGALRDAFGAHFHQRPYDHAAYPCYDEHWRTSKTSGSGCCER
jgi:hypothetical protein